MTKQDRDILHVAGICLIAVSVFVVVVAGGYLAGWWLRADSVNRQVRIDNRNVGVQTAWRDEVLEGIGEIELLAHTPGSAAAVAALTNTTCDLIGRLTDTYRNDTRIDTFWETQCI